jgi:succinate dehydrogenase hydrophobic anchor subunit
MDNSYTFTTSLGTLATDSYDFLNRIFANPSVILILFVVFVIYLLIFSSLGENANISLDTSASEQGTNFFGIFLIIIFIILILVNGLQYFFAIDIIGTVRNIFTNNPEIDIIIDNPDNKSSDVAIGEDEDIFLKENEFGDKITNENSNIIAASPEVFNIRENVYDYNDAKAVCKAYGARLATYKEVENSYESGGEWCNYGWSDGQMILFPTQQETWDNLQKIDGHKNDCGRPGVNGGYIDNPNIKYGANCYGVRPAMTSTEQQLMASVPKYPKTKKDIEEENRVEYWKSKKNEILISPFNHNNWSRV